ncbi:uncharacterized protein [Oscarella lobularis]|uniref:uncharacterized protein n=1 Tax=Oscarella lobularis TaxID=121494 RepID=UPI00331355F2
MESKSRRDAQALLADNLRKHVNLTATEGNPDAYASYTDTKTSILRTYSNPPHNLDSDALEEIAATVEAQAFAEKRLQMENHLAALKDPTKTISTLEFLSSSVFVPWYREETYYACDYFASLGGMDVVVERAASPDSNSPLRLAAFYACWAFATGSKRTHLIVDKGIVDAIENVLKTMGNDVEIILAACGITWGLLEYPDLRNQLQLRGFVFLLIDVLYIDDVNCHLLEQVLGCLKLFSPSISDMTSSKRQKVEKLIFESFRDCRNKFQVDFLFPDHRRLIQMVYYTGFNCLAGIYLHEIRRYGYVKEVESPIRSSALQKMNEWIQNTDPDEIRHIEEGNYLWNSLKHFTALLYCPCPVVRRMGAFSLANLLQGAENRKVFKREEGGKSYDLIQCSSWCKDAKASELAKKAMKHVFSDRCNPPSLQSICSFYVSDNSTLFGSMIELLPVTLKSRIIAFAH